MESYTKIMNSLICSSALTDGEYRLICYLISLSVEGLSFPSIRTIAINLGQKDEATGKIKPKSTATIMTYLKNLEEKGFILKDNRTIGSGKKTSNCYLVNEKYLVNYIPSKMKPVEELNEKIEGIFDFDWMEE